MSLRAVNKPRGNLLRCRHPPFFVILTHYRLAQNRHPRASKNVILRHQKTSSLGIKKRHPELVSGSLLSLRAVNKPRGNLSNPLVSASYKKSTSKGAFSKMVRDTMYLSD